MLSVHTDLFLTGAEEIEIFPLRLSPMLHPPMRSPFGVWGHLAGHE